MATRNAESIRRTRNNHKSLGLKRIDTTLDERHTEFYNELSRNKSGCVAKDTIQEALELLYEVRIAGVKVLDRQQGLPGI
ncbi:Iap family predicted aminopeptidase [Rheinheimera pacifica]|uniref:hypothetical protein n=1 Tax=Rheinheimera pacifica TaxID=173990 RepID=UPI0021679003|nr:hypothetical protein [Rheinheimera pacifica]MCS4309678.1 Iap family predicted aminopeptidase [Rheinheimera pacifica]